MELKSKADYATARDLTPAAISHHIRTGALSGAALVGKERRARINVEEADRQLAANLDPARRKASKAAPRLRGAEIKTPAAAADAVALIKGVLRDEGVETDGTVDYGLARTAELILRARDRALKIAERRKELVPLDPVRRHAFETFVRFRRAIQAMPSRHVPEMAAKLECDPGKLQAELDRMIHATLTELSAPVIRA